jgi:DNA gyrase subunit A
VEEYPKHGRGGQGVRTFNIEKRGELVTARMVDPEHELILISESGIVLRTPVNRISLQGRSTQGVRLMDVGDNDKVAAVAVIDMSKEYAVEELPTGAQQLELEIVNGKKPRAKRGSNNGRGKAK